MRKVANNDGASDAKLDSLQMNAFPSCLIPYSQVLLILKLIEGLISPLLSTSSRPKSIVVTKSTILDDTTALLRRPAGALSLGCGAPGPSWGFLHSLAQFLSVSQRTT